MISFILSIIALIVALIWAVAAVTFFGNVEELDAAMTTNLM